MCEDDAYQHRPEVRKIIHERTREIINSDLGNTDIRYASVRAHVFIIQYLTGQSSMVTRAVVANIQFTLDAIQWRPRAFTA